MASNAHSVSDSAPFTTRDVRAAKDPMIAVRLGPEFYQVYSGTDAIYHVDARDGVCDCDDFFHRAPEGGCKHVRRVEQTRGDAPIPPIDDIDITLEKQRAREMARQGRHFTDGGVDDA